MADYNQHPNNIVNDKTKIFKNLTQSGTNYVQNAIENVPVSSQDATQNLVNNVIKRHQNKGNH
jgi:hypothetical protein